MSTAEFESILKELQTLKAPGVSGSRIKKLTDLAVKNVQDESQLITILYSNCKATPSSHKLGTLYVVDSIVRIYMDEAKKQNQEISSSAPDGTFAAGVYKISELVESLVDDALDLLISKSQITKISKLVDIWERAETFSPQILESIRSKHFASTTPPGTPPRTAAELAELNKPKEDPASLPPVPPSTGDSGSILSALASLAKLSSTDSTPQPAQAQPAQPQPPADNANNILSQLSALAGTSAPPPAPQPQQPPQAPPGSDIFNMLQQMQAPQQPQGYQQPAYGQPQYQGYQQPQQFPPQGYQQAPAQGYQDRRGRDDRLGGYSRRNRSRSPTGNTQYGGPPPAANGLVPTRPVSLKGQGYSPSAGERNVPGNPHYRVRNVGFDQTLPQGSFKVMSRTLFVGGVPRGMDERELSEVLRPYGEVQSVILNSERRHAFVKVFSRREAEQVISSFNKDQQLPLRTRWGVGFGPRDCCNYQHGVSIIPISRLTDADRTWVVQAEWGGTGGQPLVTGMVLDEPDIEIGTGISSKAMSKKMPTNSARNGPKSNNPGEGGDVPAKTPLLNAALGQPDFAAYNNQAVNPLSGLFNPQPGAQPQAGYQNGYQQPNVTAQLANFFQNGGQQ